MSNVTFLVNSCDKNSDLWLPFFRLLEANWPDCPYPIVLNTESKRFNYGHFDIKTLSLYSEKEGPSVPWGKRLIETLNSIDTEYVLFTLDDFFITQPPDKKAFDKCLEAMACFPYFHIIYMRAGKSTDKKDMDAPGFVIRGNVYPISAGMALWRRESLLSCVEPDESIWDWEVNANIRDASSIAKGARKWENGVIFYPYGGVLHQGRWYRNAIVPLNEQYSLGLDFSKRGFRPEDYFRGQLFLLIIKFLQITKLYSMVRFIYRKVRG